MSEIKVLLIAIAFVLFIPTSVFASSHFLPTPEPEPVQEPEQVCTSEMIFDGINCVIAVDTYRKTHIENFPDYKKSPQYYIDRYNTEPEYKSWFDSQFPNSSIEDVVGYRETHVQGFPDNSKSPEYYVKRLHLEEGYEPWFDKQFPSLQIYNIVGIDQNQYKKIVDSIKISEAEKQAREEIPNPCINIKEPQIDPQMQGDLGLNNPQYMETFRESQYQYGEQVFHCLKQYEQQIAEAVQEICLDVDGEKFTFSKPTPLRDYDLLFDLISQGLNAKLSQADGRFIVDNYMDTPLYNSECSNVYREYVQLGEEATTWRNSCTDLGDSPVDDQLRELYSVLNRVCGFADWGYEDVSAEKSQVQTTATTSSRGGGCLIATATFGSELAPQVQQLREIRDNSLLQTESGRFFMESFNQFYYSFSPTIADLERENPIFKESVKLGITPLITSLSILNYVELDSEETVLGYGISLILLNVGMYFVLPAVVIHRLRKFV